MKIIKCTDGILSGEDQIEVANIVRRGGLVVYPTETVYGIGANIFDETAVKKVYLAKKRPFDMPLSVAVADRAMLESIAYLDEQSEKLIKAFLPGPLTIIIKKKSNVPDIVTGGSSKVGIRIPNNKFAIDLIKKTGPITSTSANMHSNPDAINIDDAVKDMGSSVDAYIDAGPSSSGKPSTIVWIMNGEVEIIRQGSITARQIGSVLKC